MPVTNSQIDTGAANAGHVLVTVPRNEEMQTEPARTVAKAQQVKLFVLTALGLGGIIVSSQVSDQIDQLIQIGVPLLIGAYAWWVSRQQGEETRDAVYSPAATARVAEAAHADVLPGGPAKAEL